MGSAKSSYLTKDFLLAGFIRMCFGFVFAGMTVSISLYTMLEFDVDTAFAGLASGVFVVSMAVSRFFLAKHTDVIGRKRVLVMSGFLFLAFTAMFLLPLNYPCLVFARIVQGAAGGMFNNTIIVVGTACIPTDRYGQGLGLFGLGATLGNALGPCICLLLVNNAGGFAAFCACTAAALFAFAGSLAIRPVECALSEEQRLALSRGGLWGCIEPCAIPMGMLIMVANVVYMGIASFISVYLAGTEAEQFSSFFFLVYSGFLCVARPLAGSLYDKKGPILSVYPFYASFLIAVIIYSLNTSLPAVVIFAVFFAFGYGSLMPAFQAIFTSKVEPYQLSTAMSTYYVLSDIGLGIGPAIAGVLSSWIGFSNTYLLGIVDIIASAVAFYFCVRESRGLE